MDATEIERELDELLDEVDAVLEERGRVRQAYIRRRRVGSADRRTGPLPVGLERLPAHTRFSELSRGIEPGRGSGAGPNDAAAGHAYVRWNLIVLCVAIVVLATTALVARHELAALEVRISAR